MTFFDITLKFSLFGRGFSVGMGAWDDRDDEEKGQSVSLGSFESQVADGDEDGAFGFVVP